MAGGRDTIDWTAERVETLLHEYAERTCKEKVLQKSDEQLALLNACLNSYLHAEKELLLKLCAERVSERTFAKATGLTRYRIRREKERLLHLTASIFSEKFSGIQE